MTGIAWGFDAEWTTTMDLGLSPSCWPASDGALYTTSLLRRRPRRPQFTASTFRIRVQDEQASYRMLRPLQATLSETFTLRQGFSRAWKGSAAFQSL